MDLLRLEQQRQALEANLQQLRQSLKYWHKFEAEYEGLKEEIEADPAAVDSEAGLTNLAKTYDGELVDEKVVRELAGLDKSSPRSSQQIVRDIERRQEYVQKNIDTIQRRFFEGEAKLEELDFAATRDSNTGLPLTEIHEELDDDDNVISSRLSQPETQQANLVESLRKVGLTDEDLSELSGDKSKPEPLKSAITNASPPVTPAYVGVEKRTQSSNDLPIPTGDSTNDNGDVVERPPIRKKSVSFTADTKEPPEIVRLDSEDGKKSVSFADRVAVAPAAASPDPRSVQFSPKIEEIPPQPLGPASPQNAAKPDAQSGTQQDLRVSEVQKDLRASFKPGEKVIQVDNDDELVTKHFVVPENESEEDAKIRREMLDYHLNEVGHVVAQIDLDEANADDYDDDDDEEDDDTSSHFTGSTHIDDEDTPYTSGLSDEDEEEDEFGRSKRTVVSDDYREEMLKMQQRLIGNLGPAPKDEDVAAADPELDPKDVRRLVIRNKRSSISSVSSDSSEKKVSNKKRVSFAEAPDFSTSGTPPLKAQKHAEGENVAPVSDTVAERSTAMSHSMPGSGEKPKVSKFKKARALPTPETEAGDSVRPSLPTSIVDTYHDDDDDREAELGPAGQTLAETLVERPTPAKPSVAPSADDPDPIAERRQLAAEYYRRRNDMVRQQGGFKTDPDEEEMLGELMEEKDGKLKKVSRFKAARIKPMQ